MPINRRVLLQASALAMPATAQPAPDDLKATALIESTHPRIAALAKDVTASAGTDRAAAIVVHDWVRDQSAFGIPRGFYDSSATQTLDAGVGYCNTKVNLFSALLRARGIATRIRVMDLSAQVLGGLFNPGTPYVDHAITEVFLEGRWVKVDSYVVDTPLVKSAERKLAASGAKAGFGIHLDGKSSWDGSSDNFIQCVDSGAIKDYVLKDHGLFIDVADFYARTADARNRKTLVSGLGIWIGAPFINRQIDTIRTG